MSGSTGMPYQHRRFQYGRGGETPFAVEVYDLRYELAPNDVGLQPLFVYTPSCAGGRDRFLAPSEVAKADPLRELVGVWFKSSTQCRVPKKADLTSIPQQFRHVCGRVVWEPPPEESERVLLPVGLILKAEHEYRKFMAPRDNLFLAMLTTVEPDGTEHIYKPVGSPVPLRVRNLHFRRPDPDDPELFYRPIGL